MSIPLQSTATDEVEVIMAALVKPSAAADAPIIFGHPDELRAVAEHLHDYGLRHHADEQRIWYHPPSAEATIYEQAAGAWLDHPPVEGAAAPVGAGGGVSTLLAALSPEQRAELRDALAVVEE